MSFEEEFDRIIKQKVDGADFPFDEKDWEKARTLLDGEKEGKRAGYFKMAALSLLALGLGLGGWLWLSDKHETAATAELSLAATAQPGATAPQQPAVTEAAAELPLQNAKAEESIPGTAIKAEAAVSKSDISKAEATPATPAEVKQATEKTALASGAAKHVKHNKPVDAEVQDDSTPENTSESAETNDKSESGNRGPSQPAAKTAPAPLAMNTPAPPAKEEKEEQNSHDVKSGAMIAATSKETSAEVLGYEPLTPVYMRMPLGQEPEVQVALSPIPKDEDYYQKSRYKTHFMNVEAGANYLMGWDVKGGRDGKGLTWFAGANYGRYITKKISVSAGLQAYSIANITQPFYSDYKTEYDFGATSTHTVITTNSLFYAAVPVKFYYMLNSSNQFGFGVNAGMLLGAKNTVETYGLSDNVKVNDLKVSKNGIYEGVRTTNVMASVFYRTKMTQRLYLNGEVMYGFTDIFKNLNSNNNKEQAIGLRLSLQYTLFDK